MTGARVALAIAAWLTGAVATAQDVASTQTPTLIPASPSRWDTSAHVTWLGERLDRPVNWDRWYGVASGGGVIGFYTTPHLKIELDISSSTEGQSYSTDVIPRPDSGTPFFIQRDHHFRTTTASAGVSYQFFENAWFHPFVGGGLELVRERESVDSTIPTASPGRPGVDPPPDTATWVRYGTRPFVAGGFKAYVSERAFIRSDLRTSWSTNGVTSIAWRSGIGFDF